MSAAEECRRNSDIKVACLSIITPALMQEMAHYHHKIWPTLKQVQGYEEDKEDVLPRILENRDADDRHVAKGIVAKLNDEMPAWCTELLTDYCQTQEKVVVHRIREIQLHESGGTYEQHLDDVNLLFDTATTAIRDLRFETQRVHDGRHFKGKAPYTMKKAWPKMPMPLRLTARLDASGT